MIIQSGKKAILKRAIKVIKKIKWNQINKKYQAILECSKGKTCGEIAGTLCQKLEDVQLWINTFKEHTNLRKTMIESTKNDL